MRKEGIFIQKCQIKRKKNLTINIYLLKIKKKRNIKHWKKKQNGPYYIIFIQVFSI